MNKIEDIAVGRQAGAETISQMARAIGINKGVTISRYRWDVGDDCTHEFAHCLELFAENKSVRVYFKDADLTRFDNQVRGKRTEARLASAIDQLSVHVPSPTYAFR